MCFIVLFTISDNLNFASAALTNVDVQVVIGLIIFYISAGISENRLVSTYGLWVVTADLNPTFAVHGSNIFFFLLFTYLSFFQ